MNKPTYLHSRLERQYVGENDKHLIGREGISECAKEKRQEDLERGTYGRPRKGGQTRLDRWQTIDSEAPGMREHPRDREVDKFKDLEKKGGRRSPRN